MYALAGVTIASFAAGVVLCEKLVKEYGWEGALRYVWEGEPYPSKSQELLDSIVETEKARLTLDSLLNAIEEALERARLDSFGDARTTKVIVLRWIENYRPRSLEKTLAEISESLDKLAGRVDSVVVAGADAEDNSRIIGEIRRRKKVLSKQLVLDMERCDAFIACYQVLQE